MNIFRDLAFDGILTGANGEQLTVDCCITLPLVSGAAARVSVQVPVVETEGVALADPCSLRGKHSYFDIEIDELWYHSMPAGGASHQLARGVIDVSHISNLTVRSDLSKSNEPCLIFHLSPVEFLKRHNSSANARYGSNPKQEAELFKLNVVDIGEIAFVKQWAIHYVDEGDIGAKIHVGYYARVSCQDDDTKSCEGMIEGFRDVLTILSVFFRQAVTLLAYEKRSQTGSETIWFNPLRPNLAPCNGVEPRKFLARTGEFERCAEDLVNRYLASDSRFKKIVRHLSVSVAPHIPRSESASLLSMFNALELVISLVKISESQKQHLAESNRELIAHLTQMKSTIEDELSCFTEQLLNRVDGFIKTIESGTLSFSAKLATLFNEYPQLSILAADLWPIEGSDKRPGLKEIRNSLSHGMQDKFDHQTIAVAQWHFSIFIERLIFVLMRADVPEGILSNSFQLQRNGWYRPVYWNSLRARA